MQKSTVWITASTLFNMLMKFLEYNVRLTCFISKIFGRIVISIASYRGLQRLAESFRFRIQSLWEASVHRLLLLIFVAANAKSATQVVVFFVNISHSNQQQWNVSAVLWTRENQYKPFFLRSFSYVVFNLHTLFVLCGMCVSSIDKHRVLTC